MKNFQFDIRREGLVLVDPLQHAVLSFRDSDAQLRSRRRLAQGFKYNCDIDCDDRCYDCDPQPLAVK